MIRKWVKSMLIVSAIALTHLTGLAATMYVSPQGSDSNSGESWESAKVTIQLAVEAAGENGLVLVTNGVYDTGNFEQARVMITNRVTLRSVVPHGAVIRGSGADTYGTPDAIRCVYMYQGVIDGFILEDGATSTDSKWSDGGGGLALQHSGAVATNCIIRNCKAKKGGGAYYGILLDCIVTNNIAAESGGGRDNGLSYNCLFYKNTAENGSGGGVYWGNHYDCIIRENTASFNGGGFCGHPTIDYGLYNCVIEGNTAGGSGGGGVTGKHIDCIIRNNNATSNGGGIADAMAANCAITGNTASDGSGGGAYNTTLERCKVDNNKQSGRVGQSGGGGTALGSASNSLISNNEGLDGGGTYNTSLFGCTVADNTATSGNTPGVLCNSETTIYNTLAFGNSGGLGYDIGGINEESDISHILAGTASAEHSGIALISENTPVFNNAAEGDYTLAMFSEAVNAGNNTLIPEESVQDLSGDSRIYFGNVDIGAYEYKTLCVSVDGSDLNSGESWFTPKATIQAGIDAMQTGATILVSNGVYNVGTTPTPVTPDTLNRVVITNHVTVKSLNGAEETIIQGEGTYNQSGATRCVFMSAGKLDGFTLENGATMSGTTEYVRGGGGVCIVRAEPGTVVRNCIIRNNNAVTGGGVTGGRVGGFETYNYRDNAVIMDCIITNNLAHYGGGVAYYATFERCQITDNFSHNQGGGGYDVKQGINNSLIALNKSGTAGGVYIGLLRNCTVTDNNSGIAGAANHAITVENSIVWNNSGYNINGMSVDDSLLNIYTNDPSFRDAAAGDYRLAWGSPCINAGDNTLVHGEYDLSGGERISFGSVDIGAYEFPEYISLMLDASPGVFKDTQQSVKEIKIPSLSEEYGSYLPPADQMYLFRHTARRWTTMADGSGEVISADSPLQSLDQHTLYVKWSVAGFLMYLK